MTKPTSVDGAALLRWVELQLPEPPWTQLEPFLGFVYLDPQAGLSAKGGRVGDSSQVERPSLTVRLPIGVPGRVLDDDERTTRGLPEAPSWLSFFGPQPPANGPWRTDPGLRGRFHPKYPDDLQVLVHDGEPRRSGKRTEVCWVRVDGGDGAGGLYEGTLLNQPHTLATVKQGDRIRFLSGPGGKHPLYVTAEYLAERDSWEIQPCPSCGLHETLDPPTVMAKTRFPGSGGAAADAIPVMFTAHCALCGPPHAQVLQRREQGPA